jgi:hypothetical protein
MTREDFLKLKLQQLEEDEAVLIKKWAALAEELRLTMDPATKVVLKEKMARVDQEIAENENEQQIIKSQLVDLGVSRPAPQAGNEWERHLPEIDYKQAREIARGAYELLENSQGGVLFLLQRSTEMGGRWCLDGIKEDFIKVARNNGRLISHPIKFMAWQRPNEFEFLRRLAERVNATVVDGDSDVTARAVIDKLCSSVQIGGTLIIEVSFNSSDALHAGLLRWIVEKFWCSFAESLLALTPVKTDFKVVLAVIASGPVAPECLNAHLGCLDPGFDFKKILELPLEKWTKGDIRRWLGRYSGLPLTAPEFDQLAETIYMNSGGGVPSSVHQAFMQEFVPAP